MYKIFKGFHLVETYQELKKAKRLAEDRTVSRIIKIVIASSIALVLWLLPINVFGVEGLTLIEQRLISIFVFATLMWVFEAVPAWTTSVLIVVLLLLTVSDSSLWFFRQGYSPEELGQTVKYKSIMHCFADPIIVLFIAWFILLRLFPFKQKTIQLQIEGEAQKDWRSIVVYITFAITVLLWMSDKFTGVNSNVVAMIPVAVFCITGVITKRDLEEISWSVLWMVAGGFALGVALNETGLAKHMIEAIPFNTWSPIVMIVGSGLICYAMANFISHTATAALLVPILAIAGISMRDTLQPMGGVLTLLVGVALGSSLAMVLPISTPPNALAHATGMIKQKDMEKVGLIMGAIGLILGYAMLIFLGSSGLL